MRIKKYPQSKQSTSSWGWCKLFYLCFQGVSAVEIPYSPSRAIVRSSWLRHNWMQQCISTLAALAVDQVWRRGEIPQEETQLHCTFSDYLLPFSPRSHTFSGWLYPSFPFPLSTATLLEEGPNLEVGVTGHVRHGRTVVQVEVCDQQEVHGIQCHCVQVGQRAQSGKPRVNTTIQHHTFPPVK